MRDCIAHHPGTIPTFHGVCLDDLREPLPRSHDRPTFAEPTKIYFLLFSKSAKKLYEPSLGLVTRTIELIERFTPHYWVIENVVGAIKYFRPLLGEPRMILGSVVLWGNFPLFEAQIPPGHKRIHDNASKKWRSNLRAEIPLEISKALLEVVNVQKSLGDF